MQACLAVLQLLRAQVSKYHMNIQMVTASQLTSLGCRAALASVASKRATG